MIFKDLFSKNHIGVALPPKVLHRAMPDVVVKSGNHDILLPEGLKKLFTESIEIFHFPMRSYSQFSKKISQGGMALENNPDFSESFSRGWRTLYKAYQSGTLYKYYQSRENTDAELETGIRNGQFSVDKRLRDYLQRNI